MYAGLVWCFWRTSALKTQQVLFLVKHFYLSVNVGIHKCCSHMDNFQKTRIGGKCFQSITKHRFAGSPFQGASIYLLTRERAQDVDFWKSDKISFPAFAPRFPGQQLTRYMQELYLIKEIKQKECVIIHRWTVWYSPIKNFEKTRKKRCFADVSRKNWILEPLTCFISIG